jgi:hypothetical protein
MSLEGRDAQSDESNESSVASKLCSTRPESVLSEMSLGFVHQCIALFARQTFGKEFHYARVGIDSGERLTVGIAPAAENQTVGGEDWGVAHDRVLPMFSQLLTRKAVSCPWNRFESLRFNVVTAFSTLAKRSLAKAFESLPEILERLSGNGSFVRQCLSFVFGGCLVGRVGLPCRNCAYLLL